MSAGPRWLSSRSIGVSRAGCLGRPGLAFARSACAAVGEAGRVNLYDLACLLMLMSCNVMG